MFQEIYNHEHVSTSSSDAFVSAREEEDIIEKTQQLNLNASFNDIETSSIAAQDDVDVNSVGTAVGHNTDYVEGHHYSFTADGVNKLKDRVKEKIVEVSSYPSDDYRFIKR